MTAKAEETRERIVDAALQLFREKGFDETTMRDIAAEAGVATGAAYYYFRAKEELVMAFYMRTADEARTVMPGLLARSTDLRKRLHAAIALKLSQFSQHRRLLIALVLRSDQKPNDLVSAMEIFSHKIGVVLLVLGVMHFINLKIFSTMRHRAQRMVAPPPIEPTERTTVAANR